MHKVLKLTGLVTIGCLFTLSCQNNDTHQDIHESVHMLPMNSLDLNSLDAFRSPGANWLIAGDVVSDYQTDGSIEAREGTGVLVNGLPEFTSYFNDIEITDHIFPADDNSYLRRSIEVTAPETKQNMAVRPSTGSQKR